MELSRPIYVSEGLEREEPEESLAMRPVRTREKIHSCRRMDRAWRVLSPLRTYDAGVPLATLSTNQLCLSIPEMQCSACL